MAITVLGVPNASKSDTPPNAPPNEPWFEPLPLFGNEADASLNLTLPFSSK